MLENIFLLFEFLFFYSLLTFGDYSLYFITNKAHDLIINKKKLTNLVKIPTIYQWSVGNAASYIFIFMIYKNKIGYLYGVSTTEPYYDSSESWNYSSKIARYRLV